VRSATGDHGGTSVVVAAPTYRRPALLERLLPRLVDQAQRQDESVAIVIVDNDPEESARSVVERWADQGVCYLTEPHPGIAAARNRALEWASGAEAIVFLDDDEEPEDEWLASLIAAWRQWGCAAVSGPVVSHFTGPVSPWVEVCSTFQRPRRVSGTLRGGAATNNLLLDLAQRTALRLRFDDAFGVTGGSDTMLTHTLVRRGGEIRWCDEAVMHEDVPAQRAQRDWVLRRTLRTGNVWARVRLTLAESPRERRTVRRQLLLRGSWRLVAGSARALAGRVTRNWTWRADGECNVMTGRGVLRGVRGHVVTEYRRSSGA
jgi:succinoglycan biosynthesis protein ExoM